MEVGKTYNTEDGKRHFHIIGKKRISTTGHFYIGEETKTGLIAYFTANGQHSHQSNFNLELDTTVYIPVFSDGTLASTTFVKKEDLPEGKFVGYIARDRDVLASAAFTDKVK